MADALCKTLLVNLKRVASLQHATLDPELRALLPQPPGGIRQARQRKRKEPDVIDEKMDRQQKRMVISVSDLCVLRRLINQEACLPWNIGSIFLLDSGQADWA